MRPPHPSWSIRAISSASQHLCRPSDRLQHTESWNHQGWKRPRRSSHPTITSTPPCLLNHVPKCNIHVVFEPLQGWGLPHCPGQPGPTPDHSVSKEIFPNIQSKPALMQLEAIYRWEERHPTPRGPDAADSVLNPRSRRITE